MTFLFVLGVKERPRSAKDPMKYVKSKKIMTGSFFLDNKQPGGDGTGKSIFSSNRINGVMVSVLAASQGFEPRSGRTKDYEIVICCFSAKHVERERAKTGWFGIRIMCQSGVTCLSMGCCFSELAL